MELKEIVDLANEWLFQKRSALKLSLKEGVYIKEEFELNFSNTEDLSEHCVPYPSDEFMEELTNFFKKRGWNIKSNNNMTIWFCTKID